MGAIFSKFTVYSGAVLRDAYYKLQDRLHPLQPTVRRPLPPVPHFVIVEDDDDSETETDSGTETEPVGDTDSDTETESFSVFEDSQESSSTETESEGSPSSGFDVRVEDAEPEEGFSPIVEKRERPSAVKVEVAPELAKPGRISTPPKKKMAWTPEDEEASLTLLALGNPAYDPLRVKVEDLPVPDSPQQRAVARPLLYRPFLMEVLFREMVEYNNPLRRYFAIMRRPYGTRDWLPLGECQLEEIPWIRSQIVAMYPHCIVRIERFGEH